MALKRLIYQSLFWKGIYYLSLFLLNIAIARHYGAKISGPIFYFINLCAFIHLITSFSAESGLTYFSSKQQSGSSKFAVLSFAWAVLASFAAVVLISSYKSLYADHSMMILQPAVSFFYICGLMLITFFSALFSSKKDFRLPYIVMTAGNLLLLVLLTTGIFFKTGQGHFDDYLFFYFFSFFAEGLLIAGLFIGIHVYRSAFLMPRWKDIKELVAYSFLAFIANIAYFLVYRIDYWFVNYYCANDQLGNYIQVSKVVQLLITIPSTVSAVIFPVIAGFNKGNLIKEVQMISRLLFFFSFLICGVLAICGYWLFPLVFGNSFSQMYIPFLLLIPGTISLAALYPYTAYYAGVNMIKRNIMGTFFSLIIIIAGDLVLIPVLGINGAALISSAGYLSFQVYIMLNFKKDFKIVISESFFLKRGDIHSIGSIFKLSN